MAPLYGNRAGFEDYVPRWQTDNAAELDRLLERAERDIDALFPGLPIIETGTYAGHRFDPTALLPYEAEALARAVYAQAEWRTFVSEPALEGAGQQRQKRVKGPEFEVEYEAAPGASAAGGTGTGRYSPKLDAELLPLYRYRTHGARARS